MAGRMLILLLLLAVTTALGCSPPPPPDPTNAIYTIEGQQITLAASRAETPVAPGSAAKAVTTLGEPRATGDANGDGKADTVVVLIHNAGGTGNFRYVAALLNGGNGKATATPAVLIGDRVAVTKVSISGSEIAVEYLDHKPGEPMAATPSVPAARKFTVKDGALALVK